MSRPLVSCLLVTYNQEAFVAEAIQSLLQQTYSPLEVVVSDDASSDQTYEILQRIVQSYRGPHRLILRRNAQRRNVVGHLAEAMPSTTGEFIVVAAGDDVSLPGRVERLVQVWEDSGREIHAMNSDLQQIDEHGVRGIALSGCGDRADVKLEDFVAHAATLFGASAAYSRAVFDRFGPLDPFNIFEDQVLPFRAALLGRVVSIPEPLVLWRRLQGSNSVQFLDRPAQARARLAKIIYQQQQLACYQAQRLADIEWLLARGGTVRRDLAPLVAVLRKSQADAAAAATALQSRRPVMALLGAALQARLGWKPALKLLTLYRAPGLSDWWYRVRMGRAAG